MGPLHKRTVSNLKMRKLYTLMLLMMVAGSACATDIADTLNQIQGEYEIVWAYNSSDTADPWKKHIPGAPDWVNDLDEMVPGQGYWIKTSSSSSSLSLSGAEFTSTQIDLVAGVNLIGYPSIETRNISDVLSSIQGKYETVWMYNSSDTADPWKTYISAAPEWLNDLQEMVPGQGYWIKMTENATLVI